MGITLVSVEVRNNDIAKALKLFKKRVEDSGHLQELRERKEYKKPSVVKREKMNKVLYKAKKARQNEIDRENGVTHRKKTK
jgi:small subunit ribosomal protein S21